MDSGMGRASQSLSPGVVTSAPKAPTSDLHQEFNGVVREGKIELLDGKLPDGTRVQVRVRK
jgi:hypothetical protein